MPTTMKIPTVCEPPGPRAVFEPAPRLVGGGGGQPTFSYSLGRLRPRFVDEGSWRELSCLVPTVPLPRPGSEEFERLLLQVFASDAQGRRPASFFLARELVWPLVDVLGVPQCVVVPRSDEQIAELLAALCPAPSACAGPSWTIVHGTLAGLEASSVPELSGLPRVELISAFPYDVEQQVRPGCVDDRDRLFRAYQPLLANNGVGDELRAMNFVLTRSSAFYQLASRLDERSHDEERCHRLVGVHVLPVEGPPAAPQVEVVASFQNTRGGAVRRWFQRVDVGGPFMFLTTDDVLPFYSRPLGAVRPQDEGAVGPSQSAVLVDEPERTPAELETRVDEVAVEEEAVADVVVGDDASSSP